MLSRVSKPWKPARPTVALRPSRIRRDPVRIEKRVEAASREREIWGGVAGVLLFAFVLVAVVVGISVATLTKDDPAAAAAAARFDQCYTGAANCVSDGDTIHVAGEKVEIAGIAAPRIQDAGCAAERDRGIDAAVLLADLLNSGKVNVSAPSRDPSGREVHKVEVNGRDVAAAMVGNGLVRDAGSDAGSSARSWC